jgi:hypothetical protein
MIHDTDQGKENIPQIGRNGVIIMKKLLLGSEKNANTVVNSMKKWDRKYEGSHDYKASNESYG